MARHKHLYFLLEFILVPAFLLCPTSGNEQQQHYILKSAKRLQELQQLNVDRQNNFKNQHTILKSLAGSFQPTTFIDEVSDNAEFVLAEGLGAVLSNDSYQVSTVCLNHTELLLEGLVNGKQWALRMIDAMGKPPSNILGFNVMWLGSYDECVATRAELLQDPLTHPYTGRYCKASIQVSPPTMSQPAGTTIVIGICVPNSCSNSDATALVNTGIFALPINKSAIPPVLVACQEESLDFDTKAIVTIIVCSIFGFVIVLATAYDILVIQYNVIPMTNSNPSKFGLLPNVGEREHTSLPENEVTTETTPLTQANGYNKQYNGQANVYPEDNRTTTKTYQLGLLGKVLLSFSVWTNAPKLLSTKQPAGALTAVNGIRFLSMSWVMLGHTYIFGFSYADNIAEFFPAMMNRFTFQAVGNATVSVDSFFVLSGTLLAYLALKQMKKVNGASRFGWGMYYFHRFWRLTPPYMLFLMFYVSLIKYWSNGPLWSQSGVDPNECRDSWWRNLLYINNLFDDGKVCMGWSWYLSNDMQFFVISPLLLIPLYYSTIIGAIVCMLFLLACFISAGAISSANDFPANLILSTDPNVGLKLYFRPYTRIGPYIVGIMTGYILYKTECKVKIPKLLNLLGWAVATAVAMAVLYGLYDVDGFNGKLNISTEVSALYNAVSRSAWGVAVAWVIFACATGNGGFVNTLLSWSPFVPLGRLTYCAYLVHPVVMYVAYMSRSTLLHFYDLEAIYLFLGHLCVSYGLAFCISLAFESPMMGLEKALLGRGKNS